MKETKYFLSSLESHQFEQTRELELLRVVKISTNETIKEGWLVKVTPNVVGQNYGLGNDDIDYLVLTPRHKDVKISSIEDFPCFVHIARIEDNNLFGGDKINVNELEVIAWGEIYNNRKSADSNALS